MTTLDTGIYGAKRVSYDEVTYRDLVKRIRERDIHASIEDSFATFLQEIEKPRNKRHLLSALKYAHANAFGSLGRPSPVRRKPSVAERAASKARQDFLNAAAVQTVRAGAIRMVLLDFVLPNGKALRDSTGKDCAKAGGWLTKIAASIKPGQKVGDVLSEAQVKKIFNGAS